eukprot:bmy_22199T0
MNLDEGEIKDEAPDFLMMHRVACWAAPPVHIFIANFYLLFTPMVNLIIYGVKTKQIHERVLGLFLRKDVESPSLCQMGYERLEVVKEGRHSGDSWKA